MNFNIDKFSCRLNSLLSENNITQSQLAKLIGVSNVSICRYLSCERTPHLDTVIKLALIFNVSIEYLLGISNNKGLYNYIGNSDLSIAISIGKLYSLEDGYFLSKNQIELIKKILLANKDAVLSI